MGKRLAPFPCLGIFPVHVIKVGGRLALKLLSAAITSRSNLCDLLCMELHLKQLPIQGQSDPLWSADIVLTGEALITSLFPNGIQDIQKGLGQGSSRPLIRDRICSFYRSIKKGPPSVSQLNGDVNLRSIQQLLFHNVQMNTHMNTPAW